MINKENKTAVLIFGTFSLVTKAHLAMGLTAQETYPDADIIYVPSSNNYIRGYKENVIDIPDQDRVYLLEASVALYGLKVSTVEIDGEVSGYTRDTVQYFKERYEKVIVAIGLDNVENIINWEGGVKLAQENDFLIFTRGVTFNNNALKFLKSAEIIGFNKYQGFSSSVAKICYFNKDYISLMEIVTPEVYVYLTHGGKIV